MSAAKGSPPPSSGESSGSGEPRGPRLPHARRDLKRLDRQAQARVVDAVERFAGEGEGDVVRLVGIAPPEFRLRVGDWRVRFSRDDEARTLHVLRVLPRGKAYR